MPCPLLIFSQSDYLIRTVAINSYIEWQTVQFQISWLLQKPTDLELHCLQRQGISGISRTRVKVDIWSERRQNTFDRVTAPESLSIPLKKHLFLGLHMFVNRCFLCRSPSNASEKIKTDKRLPYLPHVFRQLNSLPYLSYKNREQVHFTTSPVLVSKILMDEWQTVLTRLDTMFCSI